MSLNLKRNFKGNMKKYFINCLLTKTKLNLKTDEQRKNYAIKKALLHIKV